jgi:prophage regulatory protein
VSIEILLEWIMKKHESPASNSSEPAELRFIRLKEVLAICGKSRSSVYEAIKKGEFPAPIKLQGRSSAWIKSEILQWADGCVRASRTTEGARIANQMR